MGKAQDAGLTVLAAAAPTDQDTFDSIESFFAASGSTSLPLGDRDAKWDAAAAAKSLDPDQYGDAFFWTDPDGDAKTLAAHKLGFAEDVDGKLTANWGGVTAAAGALSGARGGVKIPDGDVAGVKAKIAAYYKKAAKQYDDKDIVPPWEADDKQSASLLLAYAEAADESLDRLYADDGILIGVGGSSDAMTKFLLRKGYWEATPEQVALEQIEEFASAACAGCSHPAAMHGDTSDGDNMGACAAKNCDCGAYAMKDKAAVDSAGFQQTAKCACGHTYSEHSGAYGSCGHTDGRGTCSCGAFSEMALIAAAGDLVWGPEDGFQDLLCDVNMILNEMGAYSACAVDATVKLDAVLIADWNNGDYWVAPITIDDTQEPVLSDQGEWVRVESGWVESVGEYATRIEAAKITRAEPTHAGVSGQVVDEEGQAIVHLTFDADSVDRAAAELVKGVVIGDGGVAGDEMMERIRMRLEQFVTADIPIDAEAEIVSPDVASGMIEWEAVFVPEGKLTDDGRAMAPGSITWRDLPLTLMGMVETASGHDGAQVAGRIDKIWRDAEAGVIRASGVFDEGEFGQEIARMVTSKVVTGVSVDLAIHNYEVGPRSDWFDANGEWSPKDEASAPRDLVDQLFDQVDEPTIYVVTEAVIGASTVCPFPAFAEASIEVASSLIAGASPAVWTITSQAGFRVTASKPVQAALVASALHVVTASAEGIAPTQPPAAWFEDPELDGPTALTVGDDGRVYGHAATWTTCHIGFPDECVTAPHSDTEYRCFHLGQVVCDDGSRVDCGQITFQTGHAANNLGRAAAVAHYDDTGTVGMDVRCGEDEFGIWVAGALRPDLDADAARTLRGAKISGDWRNVDGNLELVALLAVNVPGFPVPRYRALVSSGADGEEVLSLVAAGIQMDTPEVSDEDREALVAIAEDASVE